MLTTIVVAVALGIAAQLVAERFQLPAILPLLVVGVLCGPSGLAWFQPATLGELLPVLVHLGVAIILFEGGLSVDARRLRRVGAAVWNLVTVGTAIVAVASAWLAHVLIHMPWSTAALFGAIMTVTGPTVIGPLLRHMIAPRTLKTVLVSEGLITDPVGAVLAYLVLQAIQRTGTPWHALGSDLAELTLTGALLGFAAGSLAKTVVRRRLVSGELTNLAVLTLVMLCYMISEHRAEQSGVLAVVVMGFTMATADLPDMAPLRAFKGQLTTLLISVLFVLLAGQLDLGAVAQLGWSGLAVVAALVLAVRPLQVALTVWSRHLKLRERLVLAMTAPRGIVAAAVASLASRELARVGVEGGTLLEGMVYLAILVTGAWATVMALVLPRLLGYTRDPRRRRMVLVGANPLTELLARIATRTQRQAVVVDDSSWRLDAFRRSGFEVVYGDARQTVTYEEAGLERDTMLVASTTNDELNLLVAQKVHDEFGVEHPILVLQEPPGELGRRSRAWVDLLGGRGTDLPLWIERLRSGKTSLRRLDPSDSKAVTTLREIERELPREVLKLVAWKGSEPILRLPAEGMGEWDGLTLLVAEGRAMELLEPVTEPDDDAVKAAPGSSSGAK